MGVPDVVTGGCRPGGQLARALSARCRQHQSWWPAQTEHGRLTADPAYEMEEKTTVQRPRDKRLVSERR